MKEAVLNYLVFAGTTFFIACKKGFYLNSVARKEEKRTYNFLINNICFTFSKYFIVRLDRLQVLEVQYNI